MPKFTLNAEVYLEIHAENIEEAQEAAFTRLADLVQEDRIFNFMMIDTLIDDEENNG